MIVNLSRRVGALASLSRFGAIALAQQRIKGKSKIHPSAFICETLYTIVKIRRVFIYSHLLKVRRQKMSEKFQLKKVYANHVRIHH